MPRSHLAVLLLLALTFSACASAAPAPPTSTTKAPPSLAPTPSIAAASPTVSPAADRSPAAAITIEMGDHFFAPARVTIPVGTTVVWKVIGQSTHDVKARDGSFVALTLTAGDTFSHTFRTAGRYEYVCAQHEGDGMVGEVVVQ